MHAQSSAGWRGVVAALLVAMVAQRTWAAEPAAENPHVWKSRVTSVAVFKNGLGFFMRQGSVALRDGWCVAEAVPPAAFGTLAVYAHGRDEVVDVIGSGPGETVEFDGVDAARDPAAKRARLEAAKGLKLQLVSLQKDTERTAAGKLVSVGADFVVLESDANSFAVPLDGIRKMQVLELPLRVHVAGAGEKPPANATLGMAYLRKGVTWIPEYSLQVLDEDTAELTLRGTLVNEAEDLVHADVNFVVGVPHFPHVEYLAPVAVGQMIRTIGAAVAPREVTSQIANRAGIAYEQTRGAAVVEQPAPAGGRGVQEALGNLPQMEAAGSADYTVYTKKDLTIRRGEKAIVTLFVKKIRYGHLYRWSPPGTLDHRLVLHNDTDTAWTTGPCLATSAGHPLSEDLLKYVPRNGKGELPVTTAINVATDQQETEADRKLKAHEPAHQFWVDLVTLNGELKVRNFEKQAIDVVIDMPVPGRPLAASDGGVLTVNTTKLQLLERSGSIRWTIQVPAGEMRSVTYRYERYVPSR